MDNPDKKIFNSPVFSAFKIFVSIILIAVLFNRIGFIKIVEILINTPPVYFVVCFALVIGAYLVDSFSFLVLTGNQGKKITLSQIFFDILKSNWISILTPARIGQLYLIKLLNNHGIPTGIGASVFLINKIMNYLTRTIIALTGVFFLFYQGKTIIVLSVFILMIFIFSALIISNFFRTWIKQFFSNKFLDKLEGFSSNFKELMLDRKIIVKLVLIKILTRLFFPLVFFLLFMAYSSRYSFIKIFLVTNIVEVISSIPLSVDGLGIRESAGIFFYSKMGIDSSVVFSASIFFTFLRYLTLSGGFLISLKTSK